MSEFGTFIGFMEEVTGRRLPRTSWGAIDMDRVHADNRDTHKIRYQNRQHLDSDPDGPKTVVDVVSGPEWELYRRAAGGLVGISVELGRYVTENDRLSPDRTEAYVKVVAVDSDTFRVYDEALETLELQAERGDLDV